MICFDFLYFPSVVFDWGSTKIFVFWGRNLGIAKLLAVERDVRPQNMNFAKVERREGAFIQINSPADMSVCSKFSGLKTRRMTYARATNTKQYYLRNKIINALICQCEYGCDRNQRKIDICKHLCV